jgi:hypothetical protein
MDLVVLVKSFAPDKNAYLAQFRLIAPEKQFIWRN